MGEVYEAEQIEQGRRVALKVLGQRLTNPEDRARFLREGQLAASISDPHSVYIFGSDEIAGIPVIAMELLPGGTLKHRVERDGPMLAAQAVDAILEIIAGLEAAHAGGVLHRDVKPSNCFVDADGHVKIGDFGLSISTLARDVSDASAMGAFHGTPQFAAPEQLRGEPLDVRADIYAVGATLYYLLTGRPPFDDRDAKALADRSAVESPKTMRDLPPSVPRRLAAIVRKCLAYERANRPATYTALDKALRPFSSAAPTPATMARRIAAGFIDQLVLSLLTLPLTVHEMARVFRGGHPTPNWWLSAITLPLQIVYFSLPEGRWGASLGKRWVGLRVTRTGRDRIGWRRAIGRTAIYTAPAYCALLPALLLYREPGFQIAHPAMAALLAFVPALCWGSLFVTMRQRNGFAAMHDLATGTRVVQRARRESRPETSSAIAVTMPNAGVTRSFGGFDVTGSLGKTDMGELLTGFDPRLRRAVWIHALPDDASPLTNESRDVARPGRLRWLAGNRAQGNSWDAYESLDGAPLLTRLDAHPSWNLVRGWLLDLAKECEAGLRDRSLPALALDHMWVTRANEAKLLTFRAPGVEPQPVEAGPATFVSVQAFLATLLRAAVVKGPISVRASTLLSTLERGEFASPAALIAQLAVPNGGTNRIAHRQRRGLSILACGAVPIFVAAAMTIVMPFLAPMIGETQDLEFALTRLSDLTHDTDQKTVPERAALATYIAGRFGTLLKDDDFWSGSPKSSTPMRPALGVGLVKFRPLAEQVMADHPHVSADDLAAATAQLGPFLNKMNETHLDVSSAAAKLGIGVIGALIIFIPIPSSAPPLRFSCAADYFYGYSGLRWSRAMANRPRDGARSGARSPRGGCYPSSAAP